MKSTPPPVINVVVLLIPLLISTFHILRTFETISKSSSNAFLESTRPFIDEIQAAVTFSNTSLTPDDNPVGEDQIFRKQAKCLVRFKDENMILCYRSANSGGLLEHSPILKIVESMLESRFAGCSAAHIGAKNLLSYPELRFNRNCMFAFEIPPDAVRKGDHYWGPENIAVGDALNHCSILKALGIEHDSTCSPPNSTTNGGAIRDIKRRLEVSFPFHLFQTTPSGNRTAVIILGNLRGGEKTWNSLYEHVLDLNSADMILFHVGLVPPQNRSSSMFARSKFFSQVPYFDDWADAIDIMAHGNQSWRERVMKILPVNDSIVLGGAMGIRGSGALIMTARWFLSQYIRDYRLTELYDRFVVTRADHFYNCGHDLSTLSDTKVWIPTGQDWHGVCDRHVVCSASHILDVLNVIPPLIENPESYALTGPRMKFHKLTNTESFLKHRWEQMGIMPRVGRFMRVMFVSAVDGDASGSFIKPLEGYIPEGVIVKYPGEYSSSKTNCLNYMLDNNITPPAAHMRLPFGKLVHATRTGVRGWACDLDDPHGFVDVRLVFQSIRGETRSVVIRADQPGSDRSKDICWGGKNHRFSSKMNMTSLFGEYAETTKIIIRAYAIDRANCSTHTELGGSNIKIQ